MQVMNPERPLDALNEARNKRVIIDLKNNKQLIGTLKAFDIYINIVLDDAEDVASQLITEAKRFVVLVVLANLEG